uniref:AlNc14C36G3156 protein n=1 Tax=Albugo laibachii Nc14 TaxID=890382 RepID=F0W8N0_9STRA|nr:AlNc14C36G3156 [Albugo laibachii Nc14]|eukprot:CCA17487.1 AlNc14C36G3156 [Albugo laibachii Nc14]
MKCHRFSFHGNTHAGKKDPADALNQAAAFSHEVARRADVKGIKTIYNADQTAVFFELLRRTTITKTGSKSFWVKCGNMEKERMTEMVLDDSHGLKYPLFLVMKTAPSKILAVDT